MDALDVPSLLQPLDGEAPCGVDLSSALEFVQLAQSAQGRPEQQFGDRVYPAQPADWPTVHAAALALWPRTHDLRVAVLLTRAQARLGGLRACAAGLDLIARLLEEQWAHVHPQLDAEEGDDPTERLNALNTLGDATGLLADLREATLDGDRRAMRLADAWQLAEGDEAARTGLKQALREAETRQPGLLQELVRADAAAARIHAVLARELGSRAPALDRLRAATQALGRPAGELSGTAGSSGDAAARPGGAESAGTGPAAAFAAGQVTSRADAAAALERVCLWLEGHEPAHPAPLLIRRAQRLLDMSFLDIVRDLAPDGLSQVERLAGRTDA